jgi:predicted secreted Zn-dependent protease
LVLFIGLWAVAVINHHDPITTVRLLLEGDRLIEPPLQSLQGVTVRTYDVHGHDPRSIRASINAKRPVDPHDHGPADALTRWYIAWNWPDGPSGRCDLSRTKVSFRATVLLPNLRNIGGLDPALQERWRRYMQALERHEAGHVAYALDHLDDVKKAVMSATCDTANQAAMSALSVINRHDMDYDRLTRHGATQGARFP